MRRERRWIHISPPFIHEGKVTSLLLDGHHSLEASKRLGEVPCIDIVDEESDCEIELIFQNAIDLFLERNKQDGDYQEIYVLHGDYQPANV